MPQRLFSVNKFLIALSIATFILLCSSALPSQASAEGIEGLRERVLELYLKLIEAEGAGADISKEADELNRALELIKRAELIEGADDKAKLLREAGLILDALETHIPILVERAKAEAQTRLITAIAAASSLILSAILVYKYGPVLLWNLWIRLRRNWRLKRIDRRRG